MVDLQILEQLICSQLQLNFGRSLHLEQGVYVCYARWWHESRGLFASAFIFLTTTLKEKNKDVQPIARTSPAPTHSRVKRT